ncbi:LysR family transcriptional regulator [Roseobacter sp. HKCCD9010]|nr:LysR family transcriptional regulator [Rhodobacterales bacterium HKCCD4356]NNV11657.1 LysR family transcriptional regulator [Roseobacter sp. HKCCD7357]NNV15841.1 LysR family transcriptional regulator [Roseobacter sp. HKCCD8768]NNV25301.1 LysR family transcriptional regulator [Roseobacter sp. HKCCD8192]NNV29558.1 LysR family transcriptional regulator [Roseobacter sp. HKCCD9061]NNV33831.1 LysR family transcriptional regulator [Roseobacter sp. HKCCD9073]NNV38081.1 LysR family transcriptional 
MHFCMDWRSISFDWNQVRAFLATVEEGSLSAAARVLGQAQPTLGRQVTALEETLGVTLFDRVGKSLVLTPSGVDLLDHVRDMGEAATRISLAAAGQSQEIAGDVRISAADSTAAYILPDILADLRAQAPAIRIEISVSNEISDLRRREADIAIRHVPPKEPDLVARKLPGSMGHLYAAPSYLARYGRPQTVDDLIDHVFIGVDQTDRMIEVLRQHGLNLSHANFPLLSSNTVAIWEMVRKGLGIGIMSEQIASRTESVEKIDPPGFLPIPVPVWLTTHQELHTSRRIRLVFDFLVERLSA